MRRKECRVASSALGSDSVYNSLQKCAKILCAGSDEVGTCRRPQMCSNLALFPMARFKWKFKNAPIICAWIFASIFPFAGGRRSLRTPGDCSAGTLTPIRPGFPCGCKAISINHAVRCHGTRREQFVKVIALARRRMGPRAWQNSAKSSHRLLWQHAARSWCLSRLAPALCWRRRFGGYFAK